MAVYVGPDHDTSMVNSEVVMMTREEMYKKWEAETLAYAPDYYTIENDYDDDFDVI